jgi:hypothetical protein
MKMEKNQHFFSLCYFLRNYFKQYKKVCCTDVIHCISTALPLCGEQYINFQPSTEIMGQTCWKMLIFIKDLHS